MDFAKFANSTNITGIVALAAIISPIFVSAVSGVFGLITKHMQYKHELKSKCQEFYQNKCAITFEKLLDSIGRLLTNSVSDKEILNTMSYLYQSFAYADSELADELAIFYKKLEKWNNDYNNEALLDDCQKYGFVVAQEINRFLLKQSRFKRKLRANKRNK